MTDQDKPSDSQKSLTERVDVNFALQAAGLGVWELDSTTNQVQWDERCGELFGIKQGHQFAYQDTLHYIHPEDVVLVNQILQQAMKPESGGNYEATYRTIGEKGQTRWIRSTGRSYFDQTGQLVRFAGVAQDVSQEVTSRQQQQADEARFRSLVEEAPVSTCLFVGPELRIEVVNEVMLGYWGRDKSVIGKPLIEALPELKGQPHIQILEEVYRTGKTYEARQVRADLMSKGELRTYYFDLVHKPLRNADGQVYGIMDMSMDVTEQVLARQKLEASEADYRALSEALDLQVQERTEELVRTNEELAATNEELTSFNEEYAAINEELEEANALLNRSNENLQKFAYVASHDLQEPLRKVQQFGDILKNQYRDQLGEGVTYLDRMQAAASRLSMLIKDLLSYSRLASQRDTQQPVSLARVVAVVLSDLELAISETGAQVEVGVLPMVMGDAVQLGQLFQNLLSNALKFHQPGKAPRIHITVHTVIAQDLPPSVNPTRASPAYHRIDVADNGVGFDEKYLDRIFEVFQRLHGKSEFAGTGIGLAICEKVVTNHGGAITASSQPGQGATFIVYFPV